MSADKDLESKEMGQSVENDPSGETKKELLGYQKYVDKCAICFTEKADIFISRCKDQMCVKCLEE
jgi:hypothetical protein